MLLLLRVAENATDPVLINVVLGAPVFNGALVLVNTIIVAHGVVSVVVELASLVDADGLTLLLRFVIMDIGMVTVPIPAAT